jgi:hypothetical protein
VGLQIPSRPYYSAFGSFLDVACRGEDHLLLIQTAKDDRSLQVLHIHFLKPDWDLDGRGCHSEGLWQLSMEERHWWTIDRAPLGRKTYAGVWKSAVWTHALGHGDCRPMVANSFDPLGSIVMLGEPLKTSSRYVLSGDAQSRLQIDNFSAVALSHCYCRMASRWGFVWGPAGCYRWQIVTLVDTYPQAHVVLEYALVHSFSFQTSFSVHHPLSRLAGAQIPTLPRLLILPGSQVEKCAQHCYREVASDFWTDFRTSR